MQHTEQFLPWEKHKIRTETFYLSLGIYKTENSFCVIDMFYTLNFILESKLLNGYGLPFDYTFHRSMHYLPPEVRLSQTDPETVPD